MESLDLEARKPAGIETAGFFGARGPGATRNPPDRNGGFRRLCPERALPSEKKTAAVQTATFGDFSPAFTENPPPFADPKRTGKAAAL